MAQLLLIKGLGKNEIPSQAAAGHCSTGELPNVWGTCWAHAAALPSTVDYKWQRRKDRGLIHTVPQNPPFKWSMPAVRLIDMLAFSAEGTVPSLVSGWSGHQPSLPSDEAQEKGCMTWPTYRPLENCLWTDERMFNLDGTGANRRLWEATVTTEKEVISFHQLMSLRKASQPSSSFSSSFSFHLNITGVST